jgi:hypothetical protein
MALDRHVAKVAILRLLIAQAKHWTFEQQEISEEDRAVLKQVRDEYVTQLEGNLIFAERTIRK